MVFPLSGVKPASRAYAADASFVSHLHALLLFFIGGVGYMTMEIVFRGYTHPSMGICGGVCLILIAYANQRLIRFPLLLRGLAGCAIITAVEFVTGCVVNLLLHWNVWSYANQPGNLLGQICPYFSLLWFLLCLPLMLLLQILHRVPSGVRRT